MPFTSLSELKTKLDSGETTAVDLAKLYLGRIDTYNETLNAFVDIDAKHVLEQAEASDAYRTKHGPRPLEGLPIAIKDIFCTQDGPTQCCSNILRGYHAPYDAHVITRLKAAGAVLVGKTNMDEFAMGSSTETSAFGICRNPWDTDRIPGGSSGGSAAAVAAGLAPAALGTDTGGSIRQPASICGITGLKPTYGRVSRRGIIAFASSLDQAGPMTRTVKDSAMITAAISGHDSMDSTSVTDAPSVDWLGACDKTDMKGIKIGKPKEYFIDGMDADVRASIEAALAKCEELGAEIIDISLPHTEAAVAAYYVIAPSEASANLSRYDGVRFGHRCKDPEDLLDMYTRSRDEGFGSEVKRRILTGTFALSSGYYDAYYIKAQRVRTLIRQDFINAFEKVDLIATPTSPITAFKLGEKTDDPLTMYLADIFTIAVNLAGLPGLSQPCGFVDGLPVGLQWIAPAWREDLILGAASAYEGATDWLRVPAGFGGEA
ncbi:aspartyl/glutamyl-tRNA(Asn/Gln) amidotransferase subunit A [Mariprofundus ferrinatatus]|uniref:Glutamyl-tRNA(Gln) amidotransferase subunit A n=1 Tax=Mariprofundus ferrinatatus TaxID=1921087 RepID=A0A2K8LDS6_9PROT|nr:Asp-tRNA(Asn)/Glu-tRNA(Gln) amidotransferase subunit GatA [Mariprofundus ferrinatatus]ATX82436.1 aspartyl/glutamyl-tRNA(Asn/Gln) amidotransferase subunit A [Mariprofundus ferrinatatus]